MRYEQSACIRCTMEGRERDVRGSWPVTEIGEEPTSVSVGGSAPASLRWRTAPLWAVRYSTHADIQVSRGECVILLLTHCLTGQKGEPAEAITLGGGSLRSVGLDVGGTVWSPRTQHTTHRIDDWGIIKTFFPPAYNCYFSLLWVSFHLKAPGPNISTSYNLYSFQALKRWNIIGHWSRKFHILHTNNLAIEVGRKESPFTEIAWP